MIAIGKRQGAKGTRYQARVETWEPAKNPDGSRGKREAHPRHIDTHRTQTLAREWARRIEREIARGECSICARSANQADPETTLESIAKKFLTSPEVQAWKETSRVVATEALSHLRKQWGDGLDVRTLTASFLEKWADERMGADAKPRPVSGARVNRVLMHLRMAIKYAVRHGVLTRDPVTASGKEWPRRKEPKPRDRVLTVEEYKRLQSALPDYLRAPVELAFRLGLRLSELCGLTWGMVDFKARALILPAELTKSDESRTVPFLYPHVAILLESMSRGLPGALVFPGFTAQKRKNGKRGLGNFRKAWHHALEDAGIGKGEFTFHGLRHCAVTNLLLSGLSPIIVGKITGHKSPIVQAKYTHVQSQDVLKAVAAISLTA